MLHTPRMNDGSLRKAPKARRSSADRIRSACLARIRSDRAARQSSGRCGLGPVDDGAAPAARLGRARAILDDVMAAAKRPRDADDAAAAPAPKRSPACFFDAAADDDDEDCVSLTADEEAALVRELEEELRAYEDERCRDAISHELAMEALAVEAAGLAFDADDRGGVLCPVCSAGDLVEGAFDQSIACRACGLRLEDRLDGVGLDDLRALLAETFAAHAAGGGGRPPCGSRPRFALDAMRFLAATCADCGYHRIIV